MKTTVNQNTSTLKPYLMVVWPGLERTRIGNREVAIIRYDASRTHHDIRKDINDAMASGKIVQLVYHIDCISFLKWCAASGHSFVLQYPSDRMVYDYVDQAYRQLAECDIQRDEAYEYATRWSRECSDLQGVGVSKVVLNHLPMHCSVLRPMAPKPKVEVIKDHW